jgi:hypothetical protein
MFAFRSSSYFVKELFVPVSFAVDMRDHTNVGYIIIKITGFVYAADSIRDLKNTHIMTDWDRFNLKLGPSNNKRRITEKYLFRNQSRAGHLLELCQDDSTRKRHKEWGAIMKRLKVN